MRDGRRAIYIYIYYYNSLYIISYILHNMYCIINHILYRRLRGESDQEIVFVSFVCACERNCVCLRDDVVSVAGQAAIITKSIFRTPCVNQAKKGLSNAQFRCYLSSELCYNNSCFVCLQMGSIIRFSEFVVFRNYHS